jgi:hypothetical protein
MQYNCTEYDRSDRNSQLDRPKIDAVLRGNTCSEGGIEYESVFL